MGGVADISNFILVARKAGRQARKVFARQNDSGGSHYRISGRGLDWKVQGVTLTKFVGLARGSSGTLRRFQQQIPQFGGIGGSETEHALEYASLVTAEGMRQAQAVLGQFPEIDVSAFGIRQQHG